MFLGYANISISGTKRKGRRSVWNNAPCYDAFMSNPASASPAPMRNTGHRRLGPTYNATASGAND